MMKTILIYRKFDILISLLALSAVLVSIYLMSAILYEIVVYWHFWSRYY